MQIFLPDCVFTWLLGKEINSGLSTKSLFKIMTARSLRSLWHLRHNTIQHKNICSKNILPEGRLLGTTSNIHKDENASRSTVDSAEIQLFSQMKDWWNLNGPMKPLHSMNMIRVPFIRDGLVQSDEARTCTPLKGMKILDVGCGGGILSEGLARLGASVTGIDASKELVAIAMEHRNVDPKIADNKPNYIHTSIEEHIVQCSGLYDGVVASEVIEHVNNQKIFVESCTQALKPGGRIFFTTPNRTRVSQFVSIWMAEYVLNLLPKGTHQYEKFITPTELTFLLERNNCHVEIIYGSMYYFLSNTWEFVNSQLLMYAIQAVKLK